MGRRGPKPDQAKRKAFGRLIADGMPSAISLPNALRLAWSGFGPRRPIATPQTHGCCDVRQNPPSPELAPPPTGFLTFDRVGDQAAGGASFRFAWLVRRRYDDERRGQPRVGERLAPLAERGVRRDCDRGPLVALGEHLEQELRTPPVEVQVPQLVEA